MTSAPATRASESTVQPSPTEAPAITPAAAFLFEYLDLPAATGSPGATWEPFQYSLLNYPGMLAITNKSRQVGWSWLAAADAVAWACVQPRTTAIFVSINQDEAGEKIRYANQIIEAIDLDKRPRKLIDNRFEIEFRNGSRLISHPCRPVRGKARARIYLDEFAHYAEDRVIYQSALPVLSKGGVMRIGSSPLGAGGLFWEIYTQTIRAYPGYHRWRIPWWLIGSLCTDVQAAAREAPAMETEQRVRRFGSPRLQEIYDNLPLEDFWQEYECSWVDESIAWIDWALIRRNQGLAQAGLLWSRSTRTPDQALEAIEELAEQIEERQVESALVAGMDIGRKKDTTELTLLGKSTTGQLPFRLGITLDRVEFDTQFSILAAVMDRLPVIRVAIDSFGIGMQFAEQAVRRWGVRAQQAEFTNPNKELWANEVKVRFQRQELPIPLERDLVYQIHSVRRKITETKTQVFDVEATEKHHADKFWSLALAAWVGRTSGAAKEWIAAMQAAQSEQPKRPAPAAGVMRRPRN
jgi:phage FluMu gp28-like protein